MIGQEGVCRAIVGRLNSNLPTECNLVAKSVGLDEVFPVPHPHNVLPYWTQLAESLDRMPAIMILVEDTDTTTSARTESSEVDYDEFVHVYPIVVVILNSGLHYGETELHRQRLMLAVRNTLLRYPLLISTGDEDAQIDPGSLRELPAFGAQNQDTSQWLLESAIRIQVRTHEHLQVLDTGPRVQFVHDTDLIQDQ